jgi:CDP-glucose 4,6-dehydratase
LVERFCAAWNGGAWQFTGNPSQPHEARLLRLSIEKAKARLGWRPVWNLKQTIDHTVRWYREFHDARQSSMLDACLAGIAAYSRDWARSARGREQPAQLAA